jgi:hypothetical protein
MPKGKCWQQHLRFRKSVRENADNKRKPNVPYCASCCHKADKTVVLGLAQVTRSERGLSTVRKRITPRTGAGHILKIVSTELLNIKRQPEYDH